eukprot:TRINITY_DN109680_c0_g1_i1.p1 TRINITY_DN109680_c0_g1~~TRINITY_DN109680_c0_g1_i1.p1  ORF type:complete len:710 (-),score=205.04 TRINITY_DN109680_c0_g1_i1:396-2525(-)
MAYSQDRTEAQMVQRGLAHKASPLESIYGPIDASSTKWSRKLSEASTCAGTPLSQPSTAPCTPLMSFRQPGLHSFDLNDDIPDLEDGICFGRATSIPEAPGLEDDDEFPAKTARQFAALEAIKRSYDAKYGRASEATIDKLETKLAEVKNLYAQKYGEGVDGEIDASQQSRYAYDEDGTLWTQTVGTGFLKDHRIERLEYQLAEVREMYKVKYGEDVDEETNAEKTSFSYDEDGSLWVGTVGTGVPTDQRIEKLENQLAEVKDLYKQKYGEDVDTDDRSRFAYDEAGTLWVQTIGTGVPTDQRIEKLENKLAEVKDLYREKFGEHVDEDHKICYAYDKAGTLWIQTVGTGLAKDQRIETLEDKLAEVKDLYKLKYGEDLDSDAESDDVGEDAIDEAGTRWVQTVGTIIPKDQRIEMLERKMAEVKDLYQQKYGQSVDDEDERVHYSYDQAGTLWVQTVGTGIPKDQRIERLESQLAEVKDLYKEKYGEHVDEDQRSRFAYDDDGTLWVQTIGTGLAEDGRIEKLEDKLAEVKELYYEKYGVDVDDESDEVQECYAYDNDGTLWIGNIGCGAAQDERIERLENMLTEVKDMYLLKYGMHVDDDRPDRTVDDDGTLWIETVGTGVPSDQRFEKLEEMLMQVKNLYEEKHGYSVDDDDESEHEYLTDEDGTVWVGSVGTGQVESSQDSPADHAGSTANGSVTKIVQDACSVQ